MSEVRIVAEPRTEFGKGGARRTRRAGQVPAVLYGHGSDVRHISLPARELMHAFKGAGGANVLLAIDIDGASELALPRQIQRDPLRGDFTHVDLLLVRRGEKVAVDIPIVLVGESPAAKSGGALDQQANALHVEAEATHIPTHLDVDISSLTEIGGHGILAKDVVLPAGVTLLGDPEGIVVHVVGAATVEEPEGEEAAEEGAEGAPAEGAAGAAEGESPANE